MSANRSNPNGDFPVLGRIAEHFFTHFKNVPYQAWGVLSIPLSRHLPVVVQKILPERQLLFLTEPLIRKINDRSSHVIQHGGGKRMLSALSPMEQDGQYLFVGVNPCLVSASQSGLERFISVTGTAESESLRGKLICAYWSVSSQ